ncbi:d-alanine-d-alanine ligase [Moniliophthora roreri]|nr:d-alanine-d-alanine ligase [Moniliophthora roreri]
MASTSDMSDIDISHISGNASDDIKKFLANPTAWYLCIDGEQEKGTGYSHEIAKQMVVTEISILENPEDPRSKDIGRVVCELVVSNDMINRNRSLHGGCTSYLIDVCTSMALHALAMARGGTTNHVSQSLNVYFHSPAMVGDKIRVVNTTITMGARALSAKTEARSRTQSVAMTRQIQRSQPIRISESRGPQAPLKNDQSAPRRYRLAQARQLESSLIRRSSPAFLSQTWRAIYIHGHPRLHRPRILIIAYTYFVIRSWDLLWFTTTNPCILGSGVRGDSKYDTLRKLKVASGSRWPNAVPTTVCVPVRDDECRPSAEELKEAMEGGGPWERTDRGVLSFPVIAKPDLGANGWRVHKVDDMDQLAEYVANANHDFLLQKYIDTEEAEINVFYYRMPGEERGAVCDITTKEFLKAMGNGRDSLETLLNRNEDAKHLQESFMRIGLKKGFTRAQLDRVVPEGEVVHLGRPGNPHFWEYVVDLGKLKDAKLVEMMDDLSLGFEDGFYFGRYDIRLDVKVPLDQLTSVDPSTIRILELNGVGSELLRIYSRGFTVQRVWRDCWPIWRICWEIAMRNKQRGVKPMTVSEARAIWGKVKSVKFKEGEW